MKHFLRKNQDDEQAPRLVHTVAGSRFCSTIWSEEGGDFKIELLKWQL